MNIALYMRMSTDKQDNSIESQEAVLVNYAARCGMNIVEKYIDEGISGRQAQKRPAFLRMMDDSETGAFQGVLVYDSSRFARNLEESIVYKSALKRNGVQLISATEPALDDDTSLISDAMLGALNEMYSRKLSKAVKRGMVFNAQKGRFQVPPPYGYQKSRGVMTVVQHEADVVIHIFKTFQQAPSYYGVAVKLNEQELKTRRGNAWTSTYVKRILNNRTYMGDVYYDGVLYRGEHDAIVDNALFEDVQSIIESKSVPKPKRAQRPACTYKHWLSGLIKCADCGSAMNHVTDWRGNRAYRCSGHSAGKCTHSNFLSVDKLEALMVAALGELIDNVSLLQYVSVIKADSLKPQSLKLEQAMKNVDAKLERCKKAYTNGVDTFKEYKSLKTSLLKEKESISKKIESLKSVDQTQETRMNAETIIDLLDENHYTVEQKSMALRSVIYKIVLNKAAGTFDVYYYC